MTLYVCYSLLKRRSYELLFVGDMYDLFSRFKDNATIDTIHANRLMETLQAFGRNPSQADCNKRIRELEEDGSKFIFVDSHRKFRFIF